MLPKFSAGRMEYLAAHQQCDASRPSTAYFDLLRASSQVRRLVSEACPATDLGFLYIPPHSFSIVGVTCLL
jgi:hypothetical protein